MATNSKWWVLLHSDISSTVRVVEETHRYWSWRWKVQKTEYNLPNWILKRRVSNGSKFWVRFGFLIGTEPRPWQLVLPCQKPRPEHLDWFEPEKFSFASPHFSLQLSRWVLITSWHNLYVDYAVLDALWPCALRFSIWPILVELLWKTRNISWFSTLFHSNSSNIDPVTNCRTGDERVHKTTDFTYRLYHIPVRTQILNLCKSWQTHKIKRQSGSNLVQVPANSSAVRVITQTYLSSSVSWCFITQGEVSVQFQTLTAVRHPVIVANTTDR